MFYCSLEKPKFRIPATLFKDNSFYIIHYTHLFQLQARAFTNDIACYSSRSNLCVFVRKNKKHGGYGFGSA